MGLVEELRGQRVCIDTAPFIYFIEKNPVYLGILKPVFLEIDNGGIRAITSTVTLLEVLVQPSRAGDRTLARKYREILLFSEGLSTVEISHDLAEISARLRAKYGIRTPDALQIGVDSIGLPNS